MNRDLRRKLNHITGVLWAGGVTNPVTYIEQISYLIYLKLLDEEESNREQLARLKGDNGNRLSLFRYRTNVITRSHRSLNKIHLLLALQNHVP